MDQEVVNYILQAERHGLAELEIKQNLLNAGWDANTVEQSLIFARAADTHSGADETPQSPGGYSGIQKPNLNQQPVAFQNTHATLNISEQSFQKVSQPKKTRLLQKPAFWIAIAVFILLAGGAYAYYGAIFSNPVKIWQKFSQSAQQTTYQTKFTFSYSDPGQYSSATNSLISLQLKDIKLTLNGSVYVNAKNKGNPESDSKIQYTFGSGNTSFTTGFEYMLQNKILYFNVGDNPILDLISQEANGGKKIDWIKIDLNQLENQASGTPGEAKFYQQLANPDFKNALQKIWENTTIIKEDSYVGREKINGVATLHFKNSIDKQALKDLANQYVQELVKALKGTDSEISGSDAATINQIANQLVDKIQVKEFETWVGIADLKLYRVHLVTNAPSVISLIKDASTFSMTTSSDAKRLSDIRQMASALELYFMDHNGYPEGKNGQPVDLAPMYIGAIPTSPQATGNCGFYNTYWYQPMGQKITSQGKTVYASYQMTFCLGSSTGGYQAGIGKLTPEGIVANIPCPGTPEHCVKSADAIDPNEAIKQQVADFIAKLDFSAQIQADADYSGYGKTVPVTPPASSFDLLQKYQQTQSLAGDAKRLADIREMSSALELYFNDKNSYPGSLGKLVPDYVAVLPAVPTPPGGNCTADQNTYVYKFINSNNFQLTFCLGAATGGYGPGAHTLSPAGIDSNIMPDGSKLK